MDMLVSTEWLAGELGAGDLGAGDLVVLDASSHLPNAGRDPRAEFAAAHVPGARFLDLASLKDTDSPVPNALPTRAQLEQRLREVGVSAGDRIVLYDDSAVKTAARAWFMLRHHGYDNVAILDGGMAKWRAEGRMLEIDTAETASGDISLGSTRDDVRTKDEMLANIGSGGFQVLDARDAGRFTGSVEDTIHNLPTGHIPGSRNLPFGKLFAEDGTYLPPARLAEAFADAGIDLEQPLATTCGSGVTASVLLFAAALLGKDGSLYDGSWSEWGADSAMPKAVGEAA